MTKIKIDDAEKELADLVKRARQGEEIVLTDGEEPGVKLVPYATAPNQLDGKSNGSYRGRGILKGKIQVSDEDLFGPLPEDELKRWWGEDK